MSNLPVSAAERVNREESPPLKVFPNCRQQIAFVVAEPIDFAVLSSVYVAARWRWASGYPTAAELEQRVSLSKAKVLSSSRADACCHSGGVYVGNDDNGDVVVGLHRRLYAIYRECVRGFNAE